MAKRRVTITFPNELLSEPIIYTISQQFNLITNIHQADIDISRDRGHITLEIEGQPEDIEAGITWIISKGGRVEPANNSNPGGSI
jgi:ABC-type methionine transport system ATPase subunit